MTMILATPLHLSRPVLGRLLARIAHCRAVAAERRRLAALDADRLADLGLTRDQAAGEAARGFWDAPAHWRR
jgi:uncharacterized protein YjiS (DUF1127 family)